MSESLGNAMFVNSETVGDYLTVSVPQDDTKKAVSPEEFQIHYLEAGIGEPLILIHSLGQSLYTWRNVFGELSENYRVIAIDLPGHGYSSRPDTLNYTADEMADILNQFMEKKGIQSAHMIGFSIGAMYLLRFLSIYPEKVANCIVISPGGVTEQMPKLIHKIASPMVSVFARNLYSSGDVRNLLQECVADSSLITSNVVSQYYEPISDGLSREALMYALRNLNMDQIAEGLIPVDHEILVLWGKEDRWHLPSDSIYFQGILQSGRYYLIRNAGHLLQEEAYSKLLEIIQSYIPVAGEKVSTSSETVSGFYQMEEDPLEEPVD